MTIHHLNCISTCPLGGHLIDEGPESIMQRGHLTCHCLLVETTEGLVLIDTGLGLRDVANPRSRLSAFFLALVKPDFREEMTAARQVERLGFDTRDVRHIILSHLDFDHAGGLDDFPEAIVHLMASEESYALGQHTWLDRQRFRPQQWSSRERWLTYDPAAGESWFGFACVRDLKGVGPDILLVPLVGHTFGHTGIAVRNGERWAFLTGDAYFYHGEMDLKNPHCTSGLNAYQLMMDKDHQARVQNQKRLRVLKKNHGHQVDIFCAHDVREFERISGRSAQIPVEKLTIEPLKSVT